MRERRDTFLKRWLFFFMVIFIAIPGVQGAVVTQDGAFVFSEPSFDAEVLTNLKKGTRLEVSKKIYGSYGKFYQIRLREGTGYIAIIDVDPHAKGRKAQKQKEKSRKKNKKYKQRRSRKDKLEAPKNRKKRRKKRKTPQEQEKDNFLRELQEDEEVVDLTEEKRKSRRKKRKSRRRNYKERSNESGDIFEDAGKRLREDKDWRKSPSVPLYFLNMIGGSVGYYNYQEEISGLDARANLPFLGFRLTGPDVLFQGPVLDLNLGLALGAPNYYGDVASADPSGYAVFGDVSVMFPLTQFRQGLFYAEAGPWFHFSKYTVVVTPLGGDDGDTVNFDLQEAKLGVVVAVGYAHRWNRFVARGEGRYYFERKNYLGLNFSLQYIY